MNHQKDMKEIEDIKEMKHIKNIGVMDDVQDRALLRKRIKTADHANEWDKYQGGGGEDTIAA